MQGVPVGWDGVASVGGEVRTEPDDSKGEEAEEPDVPAVEVDAWELHHRVAR